MKTRKDFGDLRNLPRPQSLPPWLAGIERGRCTECERRGVNPETLECRYCGNVAYLPLHIGGVK